MKTINISGVRFGRLVVSESGERVGPKRAWVCKCDCGATVPVIGGNLRSGNTQSCGCMAAELTKKRSWKHGMSNTPEYHSWQHMIRRCYETKHTSFKYYGAKGIQVCTQWLWDFQQFFNDVGPRPTPEHTLGRIKDQGNYEPGNCEWQTPEQQGVSSRRNVKLILNGREMTVKEWAAELGIRPGTIHNRLFAGWSVERALTGYQKPSRRMPSLACRPGLAGLRPAA